MAAHVAAIMAPRYMPMNGFAGSGAGSRGGSGSLPAAPPFTGVSPLSSALAPPGLACAAAAAAADAVLARGRRRALAGAARARADSRQTTAGSSSSASSSSGALA
jgi:hypothetical protein